MRLIRNYVLKEFLKIFFVIMFSFLILFLVVDFFDRFPRLLKRGATMDNITLYFLLRIPYLFILSSPITIILSGLFLMDNLSKNNESLAIRSSGISVFRIVSPLIMFSFFFSIFMVWFGDYVYPKAESYRNYIYRVKIKKQKMEDIRMKSNTFYRGKDNTLFYIGFFDGYNNIMRNIDITKFEPNSNKVISKISVPFAKWDEKTEKWIFQDYYCRKFSNKQLIKVDYEKKHVSDILQEAPKNFIKLTRSTNAMNYFELRDYIERLKSIGEKYTKQLVDLHLKIAFPFVNFIIMFFCVPLAVTTSRTKGRGIIFLLAVMITFLFLSLVRIGQSLGYNEIMNPVLSVWLGNIIFGIIGVSLIIKTEI